MLLCALLLVTLEAVLAKPAGVVAVQPQLDFYQSLSQLLQQHVQDGQVNYQRLQKDRAALQRLVQQVARYDLKNATAAEKKAFYLNAYNLLVLDQVIEHYPLKSVMDVAGFFDEQQFRVAGENLTLNELEKTKLQAPFSDARVHFALVCAAKSCPPLLNTAYTPASVEAQLEAQTRQALQDPSFIRVQPSRKRVLISEIFKWYKPEFQQEAPSIASYINRYRQNKLPKGYTLGYYTYDWSLNDVR